MVGKKEHTREKNPLKNIALEFHIKYISLSIWGIVKRNATQRQITIQEK